MGRTVDNRHVQTVPAEGAKCGIIDRKKLKYAELVAEARK